MESLFSTKFDFIPFFEYRELSVDLNKQEFKFFTLRAKQVEIVLNLQ